MDDLVGFALAAAMLTDRYLTGHLIDDAGKAQPVSGVLPADPVLGAVFNQIMHGGPKDWGEWIYDNRDRACKVVRDHPTASRVVGNRPPFLTLAGTASNTSL
jgi:hypothetical protein